MLYHTCIIDLGDKGNKGYQGEKGNKGFDGPQGIEGEQGVQGLIGDQVKYLFTIMHHSWHVFNNFSGC